MSMENEKTMRSQVGRPAMEKPSSRGFACKLDAERQVLYVAPKGFEKSVEEDIELVIWLSPGKKTQRILVLGGKTRRHLERNMSSNSIVYHS